MSPAPPTPRALVEELHDRLVVRFPPSDRWRALPAAGLLALLLGGVANGARDVVRGEGAAEAALAALVLGIASYLLARWIGRVLFGHESLVATTAEVEVTRFGRSSRYPIGSIRALRLVDPLKNWSESRALYALEVHHGGGKVRVGYGLEEDEAERLIARLHQWLSLRGGWIEAPRPGASKYAMALRSALFPIVVISIIAYVGFETLRA